MPDRPPGLTSAKAAQRLAQYGPNEPVSVRRLYDVAQITIPTDRVDRSYISRPQRWDRHLIRDFMLFVGPVSSLFDFLTFYVLLHVLHATEPLFLIPDHATFDDFHQYQVRVRHEVESDFSGPGIVRFETT